MLARIAYELFWVGRYLERAEQTARMMDGVFQLDIQGHSEDDPAPVTLSWEALLAIMGVQPYAGDVDIAVDVDLEGDGDGGAPEPVPPATRDAVIEQLTLDSANPASVLACVEAAREGARTVRDVISTEMWEAINTFYLELRTYTTTALRTAPYSAHSFVKDRCALFWGLTEQTMLRDEAHAFLCAGAQIEAGDMVLRMLRVALPATAGRTDAGRAAPSYDSEAFALLHAAGGLQAYRRALAAAGPPTAAPVARFLLFERTYPNSVAATVEALRSSLVEADASYRSSPPILRLNRLSADLELRRQATRARDIAAGITALQRELSEVDRDISERYFAGAAMVEQMHTF